MSRTQNEHNQINVKRAMQRDDHRKQRREAKRPVDPDTYLTPKAPKNIPWRLS